MGSRYMVDFTGWQSVREQYQQFLISPNKLWAGGTVILVFAVAFALMLAIRILRHGSKVSIVYFSLGTIGSLILSGTMLFPDIRENPEPAPEGFSATVERIYGIDNFRVSDFWTGDIDDLQLPPFSSTIDKLSASWIDNDTGEIKKGYVMCSVNSDKVIGLAEDTNPESDNTVYRMVKPVHTVAGVKLFDTDSPKK